MEKLKEISLLVACVCVIALFQDDGSSSEEDGQLMKASDDSWQSLDTQDLTLKEPGVQLYIIALKHMRSKYQVYRMLRDTGDGSGNYVYRHNLAGTYTMSAQGVGKRQYLVNSYLEGFQPFPTENITTPLYILSQRKRYLLDEQQYPGRSEVWQSSRQAYYYSRGDCEDHAIALADWLIEMGEDARVALGDVDGDGHAWVILFKNGKEYLLEATKKGVNRNKAYPLASVHRDYHPQYMFNRDYFWENTGSKYSVDYSGNHWLKRSQVISEKI